MDNKSDPSNMRIWQRVESWGRLLFRKETPFRAKAIIAFAILYLLSPFDLVPDWITGLGLLDDLTIVSLLVAWALRIAEKNKKI
jgi:uncharacterized membrane protein YkvA (DUF1232 family)